MRLVTKVAMGLAAIGVAALAYGYISGDNMLQRATAPLTAQTSGPAGGATSGAQQGPPGGVPVEARKVEVGAIRRQITAVGSLLSNESVVIRPEIPGRIAEIRFQEGQRVSAGTPLVLLDSAQYRAELQQAQANLALSRQNYERATRLAQQGAGTERARDEATAKLRIDEAAIALTQTRLEKMSIAAPFDGVVGLRRVSVGDYVTAGQEIVNLENIEPIKVDFRVPEVFLGEIREGQVIEVQVDAFPGRSFTGEVYAINPLVDPQGRAAALRARLPNPDRVLKPGLFARVTLVIGERENALLIPEQALVPRGDDQFVFRVVDGKAVMTKVKTGIHRDAKVEILEGLGPDDVVVTAGQIKIRDGAEVTVVPSPAA